jgi:hypothetical protein
MLVAFNHVGITGTRQGCNAKQYSALERVLSYIIRRNRGIVTTLHHGDCIGVDAEAHHLALKIGYAIEIHPPMIQTYRAKCESSMVHVPKSYKVRDTDIVLASDILLVVPAGPEENWPHSGTWKTARIARRVGTPIQVISR